MTLGEYIQKLQALPAEWMDLPVLWDSWNADARYGQNEYVEPVVMPANWLHPGAPRLVRL